MTEQTTVIPKRILILLTSHRSGSTWLSDLIRCHPYIEYHPSYFVYDALGIQGRRYPGDLSNRNDVCYEIEVEAGKWQKIPTFDPYSELDLPTEKFQFDSYCLEKCHPSFFDFETSQLIKKIQALEGQGIEIKFVYLVRNPESLMCSFMNYQKRKPSWYAGLEGNELAAFIGKTYTFICEVAAIRKGIVLDYSDIKTNLSFTLLEIYLNLWNELSPLQEEGLMSISELAGTYTRRTSRVKTTKSPFLGPTEGPIIGSTEEYVEFFSKHKDGVESCYRKYKTLMSYCS